MNGAIQRQHKAIGQDLTKPKVKEKSIAKIASDMAPIPSELTPLRS